MNDLTTRVLSSIRACLEEAAGVAKAAEACAREGQGERALQLALDIEPLAIDANHLPQGLAVLQRHSRKDQTT